jgi:hypothetical protein
MPPRVLVPGTSAPKAVASQRRRSPKPLDHVLVATRSAEGAEHEVLHSNGGLPGNPDPGPAVKISDHDPTIVSLKISQ